MILSALLTSVGINLGLCFLFFTLYSILRKRPTNVIVYAPLLVGKRKSEGRVDFNLERLLPSTGWVKRAWEISEEELLSASGLDAVVFMRIFIFRLWVHFCAAYVFTGVVCYLLYNEYNYISSMRVSYFDSSKPQPHQFTIMVRDIPVSPGSSVSDIVENFFKEHHHSTYLSHTVVRHTNKVQELIYRRVAFVGLLGPKDNMGMEPSSLAVKVCASVGTLTIRRQFRY